MLIAQKLRDNPERLNNFKRYIENNLEFETYKYGKVKLKNNLNNLKQIELIKNHQKGTSYRFETECNKKIVLSNFKKTKDFGSNKSLNSLGKTLTNAYEKVVILSLFKDIKTKEDTNETLFINNQELFNYWENTFKLSKYPILNLIDNINNYYVLHDGTGNNKFFNIIKKICQYNNVKTDVWNPADIWLIRKTKYTFILNELKNINDFNTFNKKFYDLVLLKYILPFSLKQLNKNVDIAKIEESNIPPHIKPKFKKIKVDVIHNYMSLSVSNIGTFTFRDENNNKIIFQTRGFNTTSSVTQTEIISDGNSGVGGGRIGKVPANIIKNLYIQYGNLKKIIPQQYFCKNRFENISNEQIKDWIKWFNFIKKHKNIKLHDTDNINPDNLFNKWFLETDPKKIRIIKYKIQGLMMQYWILSLNENDLSNLINEMILGAKKISNISGFFYKIY